MKRIVCHEKGACLCLSENMYVTLFSRKLPLGQMIDSMSVTFLFLSHILFHILICYQIPALSFSDFKIYSGQRGARENSMPAVYNPIIFSYISHFLQPGNQFGPICTAFSSTCSPHRKGSVHGDHGSHKALSMGILSPLLSVKNPSQDRLFKKEHYKIPSHTFISGSWEQSSHLECMVQLCSS